MDEHCGFLIPQTVIVVSLVRYIERTCATCAASRRGGGTLLYIAWNAHAWREVRVYIRGESARARVCASEKSEDGERRV